jgi:hypothetical protein
MYLGSDAIALAPFTSSISYLEDGDFVILTRGGAVVQDSTGKAVTRPVIRSSASAFLVDKGNHRHFMAKEIHPARRAQELRVARQGQGQHRAGHEGVLVPAGRRAARQRDGAVPRWRCRAGNGILDEIEAGMPNGQRYSKRNAAKGPSSLASGAKVLPGQGRSTVP